MESDAITVYDNGGTTFDRYTIILRDYGYAIGAGETGNVPNGFFMSLAPGEYYEGSHLGRLVEFESLPERVQKDIRAELRIAAEEVASA